MKETLAAIVAEYVDADPSSIRESFSFTGTRFQGSIGMLKFQAFARRRLGRQVPNVPYGSTFGEALALFAGKGADVLAQGPTASGPATGPEEGAAFIAAALASAAAPAPGGPVGVDVEQVASLPSAKDFRSHEFYSATFTPEEIAYCVLRPEPTMHFCGLFSAKESLKKAAPEFLSLPMNEIEIRHDRRGKPYFAKAGKATLPPFSLSISHTSEQAVAVALGKQP